jgi:hypothetical protein
MSAFAFLPDIPMDKAHSLDQMTGRFQTVKDGLPELVKNSKDQYLRLGVADRSKRQILVILDSNAHTLAVIDFAGATAEDFAGWQTWSSRTAARADLSQDIEGGHGNGGKAFMVRGSSKSSYMESASGGLRTRMGFDNSIPQYRYVPGYGQVNGQKISDLCEKNPRTRLDETLASLHLNFGKLPREAQQVFQDRKAFTVVRVDGIREWEGKRSSSVRRLVHDVADNLLNHAQAALTIEMCSVWIILNGKLSPRDCLSPRHPEPLKGMEDLPPIPVPESLPDPETDELVETGSGPASEKYLQLRTSDKQLRLSDDRKALNVIRVRNERNIVANWAVAALVPRAESGFILGELRVPFLQGEHLADTHRNQLADTPLARALQAWVTSQVEDLAQRIQKALAKETKAVDQDRARETLSQYRDLMKEYLDTDTSVDGQNQDGQSGDGKKGSRRKRKGKYPRGSVLDQIVLDVGGDAVALAVGTTVPISYRCYETQPDGSMRIVAGAEPAFHASVDRVVTLKPGNLLSATSPGRVEIWLKDDESGVESNRVQLEALDCVGVDIVAPVDALLQGQRVKLLVSFHTLSGRREDLLIEGSIDETQMGRISRSGYFTAGMAEGSATVRVRYGPRALDQGGAQVPIGPDIMPPSARGGSGTDIPEIMLCGEDAPGMEEFPKEQRTHHGGDHFPTIIEEPQFRHVVWVNQHSKESIRVRRGRGPTGIGGIASKSFLQFIALKCFDILKRLRVRQDLKGQAVTETEFTQRLAQAEMDCAGFIDASYLAAETIFNKQPDAE